MNAPEQRPTLTAAVIARDEEAQLADCLRSVAWADELLVVVDAATRDRTRDVAREMGARVEERALDSFAAQRDHALASARSDWVLFVDADERVTPALAEEARQAISAPGECAGFWIPRLNVIMGRVVRGAGWYPDEQLRLLRRGSARFDPQRVVHEVPLLDGPAGHLVEPFVHLSYRSIGEFARKQERYSDLEAHRWLATYGRPRARAVVGQPSRELWRRLVTLRGYQEGPLGLVLSVLLAWYAGRAVWKARRLAP